MEIPQSANPAVTSAANSQTPPATVINSDFETFLKMLTTQLQNQDPQNPIQSADFAVQLATFSGVEQQVRTNELLQNLGSQSGALGIAQLADWIGMEARSAAPASFDGSPVEIAFSPDALADQSFLVVKAADQSEIQRIEIPADQSTVEWAGVGDDGSPFPFGTYNFEVEHFSGGKLLRSQQAETFSPVSEARIENGETVLILESGASVPASTVTALRQHPPS